MGWLAWIILGLIAGALAKFLLPGDDPGGLIVTAIIGMVGAVIGGFVGSFVGLGGVDGLNLGSLVVAVIGSLILLVGFRMIRKR